MPFHGEIEMRSRRGPRAGAPSRVRGQTSRGGRAAVACLEAPRRSVLGDLAGMASSSVCVSGRWREGSR